MNKMELLKQYFHKHLVREHCFENVIAMALINRFVLEKEKSKQQALKIAKVFVSTMLGFEENNEILFLSSDIITGLRQQFLKTENLYDKISSNFLSFIRKVTDSPFDINESDLETIEFLIESLDFSIVNITKDIDFSIVESLLREAKKEINISLNNGFIRFKKSEIYNVILKTFKSSEKYSDINELINYFPYSNQKIVNGY